ncbi:AAA domain-containing protein [Arcobacter sp. s6]|uniref:AAA domain-containing protein n=1 Tax=Arcobacter sp. s6 TaxID=3230363 RepID=UPI00349FDB1A
MEISKIKELCHSQSLYYYDYVKKYSEHNGKTIEKVHSISFQEGSSPLLFEIKLEKPIFDFEKTYYKNNFTNEYYFNKRDILIKEYDEKNRLLYIQVLREDINLKELSPDDFYVVTDLLFLINNLIEWYEKNGLELNFSNKIPSILNPKFDICIDTILNENQIDAVNTIFQNTYSYIWGPPGTGKTKAVLSTSVLNYIFKDKKVLIVAPTNVALEQILFGVLENTEKLQIPREKILRFGIPSKDFFDRYPEICETRGLEKVLESLENEIKIINRVIKYRDGKLISSDLEKINNLFFILEENKEKIKKQEERIEYFQPLINIITQPLKAYHFVNNCKMIKEAIKKREENFCVNYDEKLIEENRLKEVINIDCIRENIKEYERIIDNLNEENIKILSQSKDLIKSEKIYNEIFKDLSNENIQEKRVLLNDKILQINLWCKTNQENLKELTKNSTDNLINEALDEHHKKFDENKLKNRINELINDRNFILEQSTKQRIKYSQILAMTIDAFIQYTLKDKIDVDHIFCDEAGYMSNIKALSLFKNNCPITFLGDHRQLPPISEVKNDDVKAMKNSFLYSQSSLFFESIFLKENEDELYKEFLNQTLPKYEKTIQKNLKFTHRFGINLARVLNKFVYKFGFKSALNYDTQLLFINSNSNTNEAIERSNLEEALIIKELVKKLEGKSFAILTPYKKQVKVLKNILGRRYFDNIMTIHKSQGSEWDNVIFSVVDDSNFGKRKMFFTNTLNDNFKSLNLINTVVSRTKKRLIIVANEEFWVEQKDTQLIGNIINISKKVSL